MGHWLEENLSRNIQRYMAEKGFDVAELAARSGITASGIYKILEASRWPSATNLAGIAKALGREVSEMVAGERGAQGAPISPDLRSLLAALASLDDSQIARYLAMMKAEASAASGADDLPGLLPESLKKSRKSR